MSAELDRLSQALLHEGYLLYPYRHASLKNQHRYPLGTLYPEPFCAAQQAGDRASLQLQCLALGPPEAAIEVELRFLQPLATDWAARQVRAPRLALSRLERPVRVPFSWAPVSGDITVGAAPIANGGAEGIFEITVEVHNQSGSAGADWRDRDQALLAALASPQLVLSIAGGSFVSLIDPPEALRGLAARCRNEGTWPVLVGDRAAASALLSSPIILQDFPQIAPESPGDFFDATEIDEILTLRILTLGDEEKQEMARAGQRARELLERTENLGQERRQALHGAFRAGTPLRPGAAVRLRPQGRADIFDLALAGKRATVASIEEDLEGRTYVVVTVDDDPGKDLGAYGHRFFFRPDEVEPL